MIACYKQADKFKIYNCEFTISYSTVEEFIESEYPKSKMYIAYINKDLQFISSGD